MATQQTGVFCAKISSGETCLLRLKIDRDPSIFASESHVPKLVNSPPMDSQALWSKIRSGHEPSFRLFFHRHYPWMLALARRLTGEEDAAKDICQDVFFEVWKRRREIKITHSIEGYLRMAVRNKSYNWRKSRTRHAPVEMDAHIEDPSPDADTQLRVQELKAIIAAAVEGLPERCREVYLLKRVEGLSLKEIAKKLDISTKTVENQITKAHKVLAEVMAKAWFILWMLVLCL